MEFIRVSAVFLLLIASTCASSDYSDSDYAEFEHWEDPDGFERSSSVGSSGNPGGNNRIPYGGSGGNVQFPNGKPSGGTRFPNGSPGMNTRLPNQKPGVNMGLPSCGSGQPLPKPIPPQPWRPTMTQTGNPNRPTSVNIKIILNRENEAKGHGMGTVGRRGNLEEDYEGLERSVDNGVEWNEESVDSYLPDYSTSRDNNEAYLAVGNDEGYDNQQDHAEGNWYGHEYQQGGNQWNVHSRSNHDQFEDNSIHDYTTGQNGYDDNELNDNGGY